MKMPFKLALAVLTAAPLALAGCTTPMPLEDQVRLAGHITEASLIVAEIRLAPARDRLELIGGVGPEIAARLRCDKGLTGPVDVAILGAARNTFDITVRHRLSQASADIVDRLRRRTDAACGVILPVAEPGMLLPHG